MIRLPLPAVAALLLLGACDDTPKRGADPAVSESAPRIAEARRVAEERLRARLRSEGPLTLRGVTVHRQAMPDTLAVCGQVNASGRPEDPFIPYVAVVSFEADRPSGADLVLGASNVEATRVYIELLDRCFDGGGPPAARAAARPLPPLPSGPLRPTPPSVPGPAAVPSAPPRVTADPAPARGTVMTTNRHPVNIRASPAGGGEVVRIVPRGSNLQVFGEAPGGWLQVGEGGDAWGWLHSSMLEGR